MHFFSCKIMHPMHACSKREVRERESCETRGGGIKNRTRKGTDEEASMLDVVVVYPRFATILSNTLTTRCAGNTQVNFYCEGFAVKVIHHVESPETPAADQCIMSTPRSLTALGTYITGVDTLCIKSIDQLWLSASGVTSRVGLRTGKRCFPLRRKFSFSRQSIW